MSTGFRLALIWLLGGTIALLAALNWSPSVFYEGDVLPTGHDSWYHARRILDAVASPSDIAQFDPRIYAPEGSWIPWPWGYGYLMAWIGYIAVSINENLDPLLVLVYVPAVWSFVTAALILGICGALGLNLWLRLAAILCFALSPLTQALHGLGRIDHHFFEYTIVLAALLTGLRWLHNTASTRDAVLCGVVLGAACAFHNGLFVLQVPLLGALVLMWLKGIRMPLRATTYFAGSLLAATTAAVLPSQPFQEGFFTYYLLSWFHLYVSICTAVCAVLLQRLRFDRTGLAVLAFVATGLLIPLFLELRAGLGFVGMNIVELQDMPETRSVYGGTGSQSMSWRQLLYDYSGLIFLLPAVVPASAWLAVRGSRPDRIFFYAFTVFGAAMLAAQFRFHYFGSFALHLPLLVWFQYWLGTLPRVRAWSGLTILLVAAYLPAATSLDASPTPGYSADYVVTRSIYPSLAEACRKDPGVVLADRNDGHYIRFHTECSVAVNNLVNSEQHRRRIRQTRELFSLDPVELRARAPWVEFLFVRREDNVLDPDISDAQMRQSNPKLTTSLLLDAPPFPDGYHMLHEVALKRRDGRTVVVARSFRLKR